MAWVTFSADGPVGTIALTGADRGNAIDLDWTHDLKRCLDELDAATEVRVVKLVAEGRFFGVGGSIDYFSGAEDPHDALLELATSLHEGLLRLLDQPCPVVARVHGPAAGAGLSLVLVADLAVAGASAHFTSAYTGIGLSPDGGQSALLPRLVGQRLAAEMLLTNRRIGAEEAARVGLVTTAVPDEELDATVDALCAKLAAGPTVALGAARRLVREGWETPLAEHLAAEAASIARMAAGPSGQEGVAAFLEKRKPAFPGRASA